MSFFVVSLFYFSTIICDTSVWGRLQPKQPIPKTSRHSAEQFPNIEIKLVEKIIALCEKKEEYNSKSDATDKYLKHLAGDDSLFNSNIKIWLFFYSSFIWSMANEKIRFSCSSKTEQHSISVNKKIQFLKKK